MNIYFPVENNSSFSWNHLSKANSINHPKIFSSDPIKMNLLIEIIICMRLWIYFLWMEKILEQVSLSEKMSSNISFRFPDNWLCRSSAWEIFIIWFNELIFFYGLPYSHHKVCSMAYWSSVFKMMYGFCSKTPIT